MSSVTRTDWKRDSPQGDWYRYYTTAAGDVFYELDSDEGVFYDQDENRISHGSALAAGLVSDRPRGPTNTLTLPLQPNISTVTVPSAGSNYQHNQTPAPRHSQTKEEDERVKEDRDKLGALPATRALLSQDQPLSYNVEADLRTAQSNVSGVSTVKLRPEYKVQDGSFFHVGKVFLYLCTEPMGAQAQAQIRSQTQGKNDEDNIQELYSKYRPMIVVIKLEAHAICVPIYSHGGKGVGKTGLKPAEVLRHAVVHTEGKKACFVEAETQWVDKGKIKLEDAFTMHSSSGVILAKASRIRFDCPYTVQFNLPVFEQGVIIKAHRRRLLERWQEANGSKANNITNNNNVNKVNNTNKSKK